MSNLSRVSWSVSLLSLTALAAPDAKIQASIDALKQARAELTEAVKRIQADPPANEDLEAAHQAVEKLKAAIDAGAANEAADLDYARAALEARKELRTQREFVDDRRGKVKIHEARRELDATLATTRDKVAATEGKDILPSTFDEAREAVKGLQKRLADAKQYTGQDAKFAAYVNELDATAQKQLKTIDERATAQLADGQRQKVEAAREALASSLKSLSKASPDEDFEATDKALAALTKEVESGRPLEGDKQYGAVAAKARAEIAAARPKIDALFGETGLERLKQKIEPSVKDMVTAGKAIRGRKPAPEQLAEARTAALVVRGLIEKFQPEAQRSQPFSDYLTQVESKLVDVEASVEVRSLDAAKADVQHALRYVEGLHPKDEHFAEANTAITVLEKTLNDVHPRNPYVAEPAAQARQLLHDAKLSVTKRRTEVDVELQKGKVEQARTLSKQQLDGLVPGNLTKDQIDEAERGLQLVATTLDAGKDLVERSKDYSWYDREVRKRIAEGQAKIASRRINLAGTDGKTLITDLIASAKAELEDAKRPDASDANLTTSTAAVTKVQEALEARTELEQQNGGYAGYAAKAREQSMRLQETLEQVKAMRELRKKTGETLAAGLKVAGTAGDGKLRAQKAAFEKALALFKSCAEDGPMLLSMNPQLSNIVVLVDGRRSTPNEVVADCKQQIEAAHNAIKPITALISVDEGPKKAYEAATQLLKDGKKKEALAQFDECTATALIVQNRNPELRERSFEVGGQQLTLADMVKTCSTNSKKLLGK